MPVSALNALPGVVAAALPGALRRGLAGVYAARVPTMLAALALGWLVWRWSRRLWGERGALLSLLLCVFDPNLLAHGRLVTTDVWIALASTAVLYLFWRFAERPTMARGVAVAVALALAQLVKYSAVLLVPLLALLAALRWGFPSCAPSGAAGSAPPCAAVRCRPSGRRLCVAVAGWRSRGVPR